MKKIERWCQVADKVSLPPLYTTISKTKKGHIQASALKEALVTLSYPRGYPVSTKLGKDILNLNWGMLVTDNLSHGLNIFNMGPPNVMDAAAQWIANARANGVSQGSTAATYNNMMIILDRKANFQIPGNLIQFHSAAQQFHTLLHVILGANHNLVAEHQVFIQNFLQNDYVLSLMSTQSSAVPMPALLARYHHLKVSSWFLQQSTTDTHETRFKISNVFTDIQKGNSWEPPFPRQHRTPPPPPGTLISALTDTPPTGGLSLPNKRVMYTVLLDLEPYRLRSVDPVKGFKTSNIQNYCHNNRINLPLNDNKQPMCLAYHVKGICNKCCSSRSDHRVQNASETQRLATWCESYYKKFA